MKWCPRCKRYNQTREHYIWTPLNPRIEIQCRQCSYVFENIPTELPVTPK